MADNLGVVPFSSDDEGTDHPQKAKMLAREALKKFYATENTEPAEVYVVWFAYVMGGWKALVSSTIADGNYYEVTFDKSKDVYYVDVYRKVRQEVFGDG